MNILKRISFSIAFVALALASSSAAQLVGTLSGDVSVDNKGAAGYSVPLSIPPGTGGMAPELAFSYSSGSGNGEMGVGWGLSAGNSAITRGRSIYARDGSREGLTFTDSDHLYLDGKRLIKIGGTHLRGGATYRTEVDSFAKITAQGSAGAEPTGFKVETKDGQTLHLGTYGSETDARHYLVGQTATYSWALKRVEDIAGNYMEYNYANATGGENYLTSIEYTGNAGMGLSPYVTVELTHDQNLVDGATARRDQRVGYANEATQSLTRRLDQVLVKYGTTLVRQYDLSYEYGLSTDRTLLTSIGLSARKTLTAGSLDTLTPTYFTWQDGADHPTLNEQSVYAAAPTALVLPSVERYPSKRLDQQAMGDFNGDGLQDFVQIQGTNVRVFENTGSSYTSSIWLDLSSYNSGNPGFHGGFWLGDVNGDGLTDIVVKRGTGSFTDALLALSDGEEFDYKQVVASSFEGGKYPWSTNTAGLIDVDGDGRSDFVIADNGLNIAFSNGNSMSAVTRNLYSTNQDTVLSNLDSDYLTFYGTSRFEESVLAGDYNGDGLMDLIWSHYQDYAISSNNYLDDPENFIFVALSDGSRSYETPFPIYQGTYRTRSPIMGDYNGDGRSDLFFYANNEYSDVYITKENNPSLTRSPDWPLPNIVYDENNVPLKTYTSAYYKDEEERCISEWIEEVLDWEGNVLEEGYLDPCYDSETVEIFPALGGLPEALHADVNGDGMDDFVWMATSVTGNYTYDPVVVYKGWYALLSTGSGFDTTPVLVLDTSAAAYQDNTHFAYAWMKDADGDGMSDLIDYNSDFNVNNLRVAYNQIPRPDLVTEVKNGLEREIEIAYKPISDPTVYTKGEMDNPATTSTVEGTLYPIVNNHDSRHVVSDIYKDYGGTFNGSASGGDDHRFSYTYSGARTDLSGRGFLGYHSFVTFDRETNLLSYQFLTQSFPMTGLAKREQTYEAYNVVTDAQDDITSFDLRPISSNDSWVTFDEVNVDNGSSNLKGTVFPFVSQSRSLKWEDGAATVYTVTAENPESLFDQHGTVYATNAGKAHSDLTTKVWYDNQTKTSGPPIKHPLTFDWDDNIPGQLDDTPVGFLDWDGDLLASHSSYGSNHGQITYGNVTKTEVTYEDETNDLVDTTINAYYADGTFGSDYLPSQLHTIQTTSVTWVGDSTYDLVANDAPLTTHTYHTSGDKAGQLSKTTVTIVNEPKLNTETNYTYFGSGGNTSNLLDKVTLKSLATAGDDEYFAERTTTDIEDYDSKGRFPIHTKNAYGHWQKQTFDPVTGNPTDSWDINRWNVSSSVAEAVVTEYDALGRATQVTDPLLATQDLVTTSTYAANTTVSITPNQEAKNRGAPDGNTVSAYSLTVTATKQPPVTTYYNRLAQPIRVAKTGYDGQVTYTDTLYDEQGKVVALSTPYQTPQNPHWTYTAYDDWGRLDEIVAPAFGSTVTNGLENRTSKTTHTYHGRVSQVRVQAYSPQGTLTQTTTTQVDAKGQAIAVWNADNSAATLDSSNYTGLNKATASIQYDLDAAGRMRKTHLRGNGGAFDSALEVLATYDALGNQTQLDDPDKGIWTYVYDALGQLKKQTNANLNVTEQSYDVLGRQLSRSIYQTDNGTLDETASWHYWDSVTDSATNRVAKPSDGTIGALQRMDNDSLAASGQTYAHSVSYTYDKYGQLRLDLHSVDDKFYYFYTDYDAYGRVDKRNYFWRPAGLEDLYSDQAELWNKYGLQYAYDSSYSYVKTITDSQGRTWWEAAANDGYDLMDRPAEFRKGSGHWTYREYDPASQLLESIVTGLSLTAAKVQDLDFEWDGLGNLTRRGSDLSGYVEYETFGYDNLNRLEKQGVNTATLSQIATYNNIGNILKKVEVARGIVDKNGKTGSTIASDGNNFQYDSVKIHAVTQGAGFTMGYDSNGNMNSRTGNGETWSYDWTAFDKPRWMHDGSKGSEFIYDATHQRSVHLKFDRVGSSNHSTDKKIYVGGNMEIDFANQAASGQTESWKVKTTRIYIDGPEGRSGAYEFRPEDANGDNHLALVYHQDHLGSVQAITDGGDVGTAFHTDEDGKASVFSYDPWGERRNPANWAQAVATTSIDGAATRGFTDHEILDNMGLVHMNGRIYDPLMGRFLSADKKIPKIAFLQSYNRYSYVLNNPLRYTDPSGFDEEEERLRVEANINWGKGIPEKALTLLYNNTVGPVVDFFTSGGPEEAARNVAVSVSVSASVGIIENTQSLQYDRKDGFSHNSTTFEGGGGGIFFAGTKNGLEHSTTTILDSMETKTETSAVSEISVTIITDLAVTLTASTKNNLETGLTTDKVALTISDPAKRMNLTVDTSGGLSAKLDGTVKGNGLSAKVETSTPETMNIIQEKAFERMEEIDYKYPSFEDLLNR